MFVSDIDALCLQATRHRGGVSLREKLRGVPFVTRRLRGQGNGRTRHHAKGYAACQGEPCESWRHFLRPLRSLRNANFTFGFESVFGCRDAARKGGAQRACIRAPTTHDTAAGKSLGHLLLEWATACPCPRPQFMTPRQKVDSTCSRALAELLESGRKREMSQDSCGEKVFFVRAAGFRGRSGGWRGSGEWRTQLVRRWRATVPGVGPGRKRSGGKARRVLRPG